jgi:hypothetical protein
MQIKNSSQNSDGRKTISDDPGGGQRSLHIKGEKKNMHLGHLQIKQISENFINFFQSKK